MNKYKNKANQIIIIIVLFVYMKQILLYINNTLCTCRIIPIVWIRHKQYVFRGSQKKKKLYKRNKGGFQANDDSCIYVCINTWDRGEHRGETTLSTQIQVRKKEKFYYIYMAYTRKLSLYIYIYITVYSQINWRHTAHRLYKRY